MVRTAQDIIIKPIITEKSMEGIALKKYTFKVSDAANKIEINTMRVKGHLTRQGRSEGYTSDWKKAIVTLKEDSKSIEFFEGMV